MSTFANPPKSVSKRTIFIGGLPGSATQIEIREFFSQFGKIVKIKMHGSQKKSNYNKGYAILQYETESSYRASLKRPEHILFNRVIMCQPYLQGRDLSQYLEDLNSRRLFVKYIPKNINNEQFENLFTVHGEVDFGYVVKDP